MKASLMYGPNDIRYEEIKTPNCPKDGMLLKVKAIGLCGSDIRNLTSDSCKGVYPHVYGHEIVGEIVSIGEISQDYEIGENIYIYPAAHCLKCEPCRQAQHQFCEGMPSYTSRLGGFADYYVITKDQLESDAIYKVPKGIELTAATLGEPLSSVYACQENINVTFGDTVVIIGAGPIGCFHIKLAKMHGARTVILIDINNERLKLAKQFDADYYINSSEEDPIEAIMKITNGKGAEKVISANPSVEAQSQSIYMAKKGGIVVFFGGVPKGKTAVLDTNRIHYYGLWVYGHYGANSMQVQRAFELALSEEFEASKFITHILPLSKINEGIQLAKSGKALKVVLIPNEEEYDFGK
jgi:L-iditol 2-dehydrogenase